jgi:hypothetical protein
LAIDGFESMDKIGYETHHVILVVDYEVDGAYRGFNRNAFPSVQRQVVQIVALQLVDVLAHHPESCAHATVYKASDVGDSATCFALFANVLFRSLIDFLLLLLKSLEFKHSKFIIEVDLIPF